MTENKRLDSSFGPAGTIAGAAVFVAGVFLTYSHISGIILLLIGAFVGFTHTSSQIDYKKKRARLSTNLFGIIRTGSWIGIQPSMAVAVKESALTWRSYSLGNRPIDAERKDFRVILVDASQNEIMPLLKAKTLESALSGLRTIGARLELKIVS